MEPTSPTVHEVVASLLRRWRTALCVAVPLVLGVTAYAQTLPTTWEATATVAFSPRPDAAVGADTVSLVVPSYVSFLDSYQVQSAVAAQYGLAEDALEDSVELGVPPTTATLDVTVTGEDPSQLAGLANALARAAVSRATQDPVLSAVVVAEAVPPRLPAGPARSLLLLCGLLAAVLAGLVAALLHDRALPRVRAEALPGTDLPVLARLPRTGVLRHPAGEGLSDPAVGVVVRALRDRLTATTGQQPVLVLAVCSAGRREGRTTVAALLAHAFAGLGVDTVLVDADLARQGLTDEYLFALPAWDLVDVLAGRTTLERATEPTGVPGLSIVPAGRYDASADLFARALPVLGAALRTVAVTPARVPVPAGRAAAPELPATSAHGPLRVVVLDTPPLLVRDEAALLARLADGVLLVAADGRPAAPLAQAARLLQEAGAQPLGLLVNRCRPSLPGLSQLVPSLRRRRSAR